MKPIYFPYTYVSDPVAEALTACFGQFIIYRPVGGNISEQMQAWLDRGVMDLRVPVTGDENKLKTAVRDYRIWADLHGGVPNEKPAILNTRMNSLPLFNDISSSKIIEDIKEKIHGHPNTQIPDPVLAARIFLYFAQEFDRQNHELTDALDRYDQQEADLFRRLKMEDDPVAGQFRVTPKQLPDPLSDYMISDRLEAWTRIFDRDPQASNLFVTHSPDVLEHLLVQAPTAARVMHFKSIPLVKWENGKRAVWQENLALNLIRIAEHGSVESPGESMEPVDLPAAEHTVALSVYRVPDQTPWEFFSSCAKINRPAADDADRKSQFKNTLIALIGGSLNAQPEQAGWGEA